MDAFTDTTGERRATGSAPACAPTLGGPGHTADLRACAARLETLTHKCRDFLLSQQGELEAWLRRCQQGTGGPAAEADLDRQNANWEQTRRAEARRIEQERILLADAWQRLEVEQRKLLVQGPSVRHAPAPASRTAKNNSAAAVPESPAVGSTEMPNSGAAEPGRPSVSRELVLVQFEQLKSDVRRHTLQCRRSG